MSSKAEKDSAEDVGSAETSRPKSGKDEKEPGSSDERRASVTTAGCAARRGAGQARGKCREAETNGLE